jgi:hypothetical protein
MIWTSKLLEVFPGMTKEKLHLLLNAELVSVPRLRVSVYIRF